MMAYQCPFCGAISHNPTDEIDRYCERCHRFANDRITGGNYILDAEHRPQRVRLMEWAAWFEANAQGARRVGSTDTELFRISTVFLGTNHQWGKGPPIVFETMVFEREAHDHPLVGRKVREELDGECWRYSTWDDAVAGHAATVRRVQRLEAEATAKAKIRARGKPQES